MFTCFDGVFKGNHFEFFVEDVIRGNLKFDFSGDCSKNLISTSALSLSFDLKEHHTEVFAQLILISVIKQSARAEKQTNQ